MNQELKEKIEQVSVEPNEDVWVRINKTMRRKLMVRRVAISSVVVALLAGVGVALLNRPAGDDAQSSSVVNEQFAVVEQQVSPMAEVVPVEQNEPAPQKIMNTSTSYDVVSTVVAADSDVPVVELVSAQGNVQDGLAKDANVYVPTVETETSDKAAGQRVVVESVKVQSPVCGESAEIAKVEVESEVEVQHLDEGVMGVDDLAKEASDDAVVDRAVLLIPNFFAPDGDVEENRVFRVRTINNITLNNFSMYIYDRRGQKVMQTKNMNDSWDGTYQSRRMPQGAYVYVINYVDVNGEPRSERGTVTLVR